MSEKKLSIDVKVNKNDKPLTFKKIRIKRIADNNGKCQECGKSTINMKKLHLHHKNRNRKDNREENLVLLCCKCHLSLHKELNHKNFTLKPCIVKGCKLFTTSPWGLCFYHYKQSTKCLI